MCITVLVTPVTKGVELMVVATGRAEFALVMGPGPKLGVVFANQITLACCLPRQRNRDVVHVAAAHLHAIIHVKELVPETAVPVLLMDRLVVVRRLH